MTKEDRKANRRNKKRKHRKEDKAKAQDKKVVSRLQTQKELEHFDLKQKRKLEKLTKSLLDDNDYANSANFFKVMNETIKNDNEIKQKKKQKTQE